MTLRRNSDIVGDSTTPIEPIRVRGQQLRQNNNLLPQKITASLHPFAYTDHRNKQDTQAMLQKVATLIKLQLITQLLSLCALLPITSHAQATNSTTKIDTNSITLSYIDDAKLTPAQVKTVLALAKDCGLKSPAVVRTLLMRPTNIRLISVQSTVRTNGRKITFDEVSINCSKWSQSAWEREAGAKYHGDFWVNPPYLITNSYTLFQINNRPVKLQLDEHIPLPVADKILKCFEEGKIEFPPGMRMDLTK